MAVVEVERVQGPTRRQFQDIFDVVLEYEAIVDPPNINSNAFYSESLTIPGTKLGDFVWVSCAVDQQDINISGHVESAGTVNVHYKNNTAGAIDLGETQLHILIFRPFHQHRN